jgi:hypothetical protein
MSYLHQELFKKGTGAYALKRYKESALTYLLQDLVRNEAIGIHPTVCETLKVSLHEAVVIVGEVGGDWAFLKGFSNELQDFVDIYIKWNGYPNSPEHSKNRKATRIELLNYKRKMWRRQFDLHIKKSENKDEQLNKFSELEYEEISKLHESFKELGSSTFCV